MRDNAPRWNIPLHAKPTVAMLTLGRHGPRYTERFCSQQHWQMHLYRYTATLRVNGQTLPIRPGSVSVVPPGVAMEYEWGERALHLCAHFSLPAVGNADALSEQANGMAVVPAMQEMGEHFAELYRSLEEAAAYFAVAPLRAEVRVWDILWQLTAGARPQSAPPLHVHTAPVQRARELIALRLGEPLSVKALAEEVGVSHNSLTRLFHQAEGDTVIGYIRRRRAQQARHLLEHTTLPIKAIAAQVGVEDPRLFYKLMRAHLGLSPSQVRRNALTRNAPDGETG